jgi:5-oxopent-3-ene-1,2,5-tricarboxylate decarboxylase/2-hydroxyhepta-2,4-diene-1,7-dioate isomerase
MNSPYLPRGTVYGTLLNFQREHALWAPQMTTPPYKAGPQAPVLYVKTANTFTRNGGTVAVPARVPQVEVGATLAMVFGPQGGPRVAHWVLMNDLCVPHASYFRPPVKFKCLDGFLGVGAACVPPAALGDPAQVKLEVRVNGDLKQALDFSELVRDAATLARDIGEFMTLREGDVLMLGLDCLAAGGRPLAQVGDTVEIHSPSHSMLGVLSNTLVGEAS